MAGELGGVLTVLSILADMYMGSKEDKMQKEKEKEEQAYNTQVTAMNRKRNKDEYINSKRGAIGRAIDSKVSLNMPMAPLNYPEKPAPYKTPSWMNEGKGLTSAARLFSSTGAADQLQGGLEGYYNGYGSGIQSPGQTPKSNYNTIFSPNENRYS